MNTKTVPFLLTLAAVLTGHCLALTPVTEGFPGSKINKSRWYQYKIGKGRFVQSKGRLNFVVSGKPTKNDYVSLELSESRPGAFEDWEMIVDLTNTAEQQKNSQVGCGFMIFNDRDRKDYLFVNFFGKEGIDAGVYDNSVFAHAKPLSLRTGVPKGAIRVSYSKKTKLMTFSASLKQKKEGYQWIEVGTFAPNGAKKADVKAAWDVSTTDGLFGIDLFGYGISQAVTSGKISMDNFSLQAP